MSEKGRMMKILTNVKNGKQLIDMSISVWNEDADIVEDLLEVYTPCEEELWIDASEEDALVKEYGVIVYHRRGKKLLKTLIDRDLIAEIRI